MSGDRLVDEDASEGRWRIAFEADSPLGVVTRVSVEARGQPSAPVAMAEVDETDWALTHDPEVIDALRWLGEPAIRPADAFSARESTSSASRLTMP